MQNSFNIHPDETKNGLIEEIENEDNDYYVTLSLNNFSSPENEQTFPKELYLEDSDKPLPLETEETLRKERYIISTDGRIDEKVICLKLRSQASTEFGPNDSTVLPRTPGEGWSLKLLLANLSQGITTEDLKIIKHLVQDERPIRSSMEIFVLMLRRKFITDNDVLYLQIIMAVLRKDPLVEMVYKYAQSKKNILHFDPPLKDLEICDSLEEVSVRGADFGCYTSTQLHEFCSRIKHIVTAFIKSKSATNSCRLLVSCIQCDSCNNGMHTFVDKTTETTDSISPEETQLKSRSSRSHTVFCDTGLQTDDYQRDSEQEITHLKRKLTEEKYKNQQLSNKLSAMRASLEISDDAQHLQLNGQESFRTCHADIGGKDGNLDTNESYFESIKSKDYQLNSLKKQHALMLMKTSSCQVEFNELKEKYKEMVQIYDETVKKNTELKVQRTDTEIQMGILQKNFEEIEVKLKTRIEKENSLIIELRNELQLTEASLLNAQNDKRLHELKKCLEQLASMSMTVKKVYGNFDPAHEHILPEQDEIFRKALSGKIGRIYPQIYYQKTKR